MPIIFYVNTIFSSFNIGMEIKRKYNQLYAKIARSLRLALSKRRLALSNRRLALASSKRRLALSNRRLALSKGSLGSELYAFQMHFYAYAWRQKT